MSSTYGDEAMTLRSLRRAAAIVLAALGLAIATYLTAYQLGMFRHPWDPLFGAQSSERVLHSSFAERLPFPDAVLGAFAYAVEVVLGVAVVAGARGRRWRSTYAAVVVAMALGSAGLMGVQVAVVHHLCGLCSVSAIISWLVAAIVVPDAFAGLVTAEDRRPLRSTSSDPASAHQQRTTDRPTFLAGR